jgi:hypothetical protein
LATAYEGDSYNPPQLVVGGLMAVGLLGTGILFGRFTSSGAGLSAVIIAAVVSVVLFALWMYGFSSWCDGCGVR